MPNAFDGLGSTEPYVPDYLQDEIQFRIDNDLRTIAIPADGVILGVVGDKNVNHVNFQMPAWYNGFDMSTFQARINFIDAGGNANYYTVTDMTVMTPEGTEVEGTPGENDIIYFTWLVDSYATGYVGQVRFNVRLTKHDTSVNPAVLSQAFNTQINSCQVLEGIQLAEEITQEQAEDLLFHYSSELGDIAEGYKHDIEEKAAAALETIPDDYASLQDSVTALTTDLNGNKEILNATNNSVAVNTNIDYIFDEPVEIAQALNININVTGTISYNAYILYNSNGTDREIIVRSSSTNNDINVVKNKKIYGIRLWVNSQTSSTINTVATTLGLSKSIAGAFDNALYCKESMESTNLVSRYDVDIPYRQNVNIYLPYVVEKGDNIFIRVSVKMSEETSRYKIIAVYSDNTTDNITDYSKTDKDIVFNLQKDLSAIRLYTSEGTANTADVVIDKIGIINRLNNLEENTNVIANDIHDMKASDINIYKNSQAIQSQTNYDLSTNLSYTKDQGVRMSVEFNQNVRFRMYLLYSDGTRDVIFEGYRKGEAVGVVRDVPLTGFRIYIIEGPNAVANITIEKISLYDRVKRVESEILPSVDVLKRYPRNKVAPILMNLKWNGTSLNTTLPYKPLVLMHFSDLHGDETRLKRIVDFKNQYYKFIDDVIHTGDSVLSCWESGFDLWDNAGAGGILNLNGNHDTWTGNAEESGCKPWTTGYSAKQGYERYIEPYISLENISYVINKMYWYKDYSGSKIRIIAIDNYHWKETVTLSDNTQTDTYPDGTKTDNGEQLIWLNNVLLDAKENGYSVIMLSHAPYQVDGFECSFNTIDEHRGSGLQTEALTAVQNFIEYGGKFISWICGHNHQDWFGTVDNFPNQTLITIDTARDIRSDGAVWSNNRRPDDTDFMDCFNIISVDVNTKHLSIIRFGQEYDRHGRHIGTLVYKYDTKEVIWNS